jgi:hypothetical protein
MDPLVWAMAAIVSGAILAIVGLVVFAWLDRRELPHTAPTAAWCPRCGACSCLELVHLVDHDTGEPIVATQLCPMHGEDTTHPEHLVWL